MRRFLLVCGLLAGILQADVRLPSLFSDHMLLQRERPVRVWGAAEPGERVTVEFRGASAAATAGPTGRWEAWLAPMQAGGPFSLTVRGNNTVTFTDVLVGDVWVASGQSNMQWTVARSANAKAEIAAAKHPRIRLFQVAHKVAEYPADDVTGTWQTCNPDTIKDFSAVGYFFARDLENRLKVPVGIIHSSWGGTPAESWTSSRALAADPALVSVFADWAALIEGYPRARAEFERKLRPAPPGPGHHWTPSGLYNAMVAPLTPYAIRGAIWYQGENNAHKARSYEYRRLFRTMIEDWRNAWGQGDFPFLFVQLANYAKTNPGSQWPELREAQTMALALRNTGMAVTIDIGDPGNIHPANKQEVGRRLALAARAVAHGEAVEWSGPLYRQATVEGGALRLWFDHAGKGLVARNGALKGFTVAGRDGKFVPAQARIDGSAVLVSSPDVPEPVAARYGWADNPECNLYNAEGLPASPFRTDRPHSLESATR